MEKQKEEGSLDFSVKSFVTALVVIFALMVVTYVLTLVIPGGAFERDAATGELIEGSFRAVEGGILFWKWILSPFMVLGAQGSGTLIAVIVYSI